MARYYSSLFGQLAFKFFQIRMADFTLFVGIKKNSFKVFGDGRRFAPASRGYENFHFVTIFSNKDGRLHFVRRHPLSYENKIN